MSVTDWKGRKMLWARERDRRIERNLSEVDTEPLFPFVPPGDATFKARAYFLFGGEGDSNDDSSSNSRITLQALSLFL